MVSFLKWWCILGSDYNWHFINAGNISRLKYELCQYILAVLRPYFIYHLRSCSGIPFYLFWSRYPTLSEGNFDWDLDWDFQCRESVFRSDDIFLSVTITDIFISISNILRLNYELCKDFLCKSRSICMFWLRSKSWVPACWIAYAQYCACLRRAI
jgi:hypothetical protein